MVPGTIARTVTGGGRARLLRIAALLLALSGCGKGESCYDRCDKVAEECKARARTWQERENCKFDAVGCYNRCYSGGLTAPTAPGFGGAEETRARPGSAGDGGAPVPARRERRGPAGDDCRCP